MRAYVTLCANIVFYNKLTNMTMDGEKPKQAQEFGYLGSTVSEGGRHKREIVKRISQANMGMSL